MGPNYEPAPGYRHIGELVAIMTEIDGTEHFIRPTGYLIPEKVGTRENAIVFRNFPVEGTLRLFRLTELDIGLPEDGESAILSKGESIGVRAGEPTDDPEGESWKEGRER